MTEKVPEQVFNNLNRFNHADDINSAKIEISNTNPFLKLDLSAAVNKKPNWEKKVLVIEDDDALRFLISSALKYEDYQVLEANNGNDGFSIAKRYLPDLIISDIMMPMMDGFETLTKLKNDPDTINIPFIFLTSLKSEASQRLSHELGASCYLVKSFRAKEVIKVIEEQIVPKIH